MNANNDAHIATLRDLRDWSAKDGDKPALAAAIRALSADREAVDVGELDRSAPPRVWLQVDTDGDNEDRSDPIPREAWGDLTWHYEPIGGQEVQYIRADLVPPSPAESAEGMAATLANRLRLRGKPRANRGDEHQPLPCEQFADEPAAPSQVSDAAKCLMSSEGDWTVLDCPHCGMCVTYSRKEASSKEAFRDLCAENASLRAALEAAQPQPGRVEGMVLVDPKDLEAARYWFSRVSYATPELAELDERFHKTITSSPTAGGDA